VDLRFNYIYLAVAEEVSFAFVKPHAFEYRNKIVDMIRSLNLEIHGQKQYTFSEEKANEHYQEHQNKGFFKDLIRMVTAGPTYMMLAYGDNAIQKLIDIAGETDPISAKKKYGWGDMPTIRGIYGVNKCENAFHRSDSKRSAKREVFLHYKRDEIPEKLLKLLDSY